jgi:hypothetical protein
VDHSQAVWMAGYMYLGLVVESTPLQLCPCPCRTLQSCCMRHHLSHPASRYVSHGVEHITMEAGLHEPHLHAAQLWVAGAPCQTPPDDLLCLPTDDGYLPALPLLRWTSPRHMQTKCSF